MKRTPPLRGQAALYLFDIWLSIAVTDLDDPDLDKVEAIFDTCNLLPDLEAVFGKKFSFAAARKAMTPKTVKD